MGKSTAQNQELIKKSSLRDLSDGKLQDHRLILPISDTHPPNGICCLNATNLGACTEYLISPDNFHKLADSPGQTPMCHHGKEPCRPEWPKSFAELAEIM